MSEHHNKNVAPLAVAQHLRGGEHTDPDALVEAIAQRVAELLRPSLIASTSGLVDAAGLAELLGVSRDTVYAYADELGAVRVGQGNERPRLRFDAARAVDAWTARSADSRSQVRSTPVATPISAGRRRRSAATSDDLLPIRGDRRAA